MGPYQFTRLEQGRKIRSAQLAEILRFADASTERWLFVSPHDDDIAVGGAMWVDAAVQAGVTVDILVVTDGRMGYCSPAQQHTIAAIRQAETYESFAVLGVPQAHVNYIGYPDGGLVELQGRRVARPGEAALAGHVGLQNAMTWHLRKTQPTRVFVPSAADLHPDHRITYQELLISIFHASGTIWPELGRPLAAVPMVYEMAVYCDFAQAPNLELRGDEKSLSKKLQSIEAYRSQEQIAQLIESLRRGGPYEYLHELTFPLYSPSHYRPLFA